MNDKARVVIKILVLLIVAGVLIYKFAIPVSNAPSKIKSQTVSVADSAKQAGDKSISNESDSSQQTGQKTVQKHIIQQKESKPNHNQSSASEKTKTVNEQQPVWMLFRSTSCLPCIEMQKTMDALAPEFKDKIQFVAIDVNDPANQEQLEEYKIQYIPTTYLYDINGKLFFQQIGAMSVEDMRAKLNALLEVK